MCTVVLLDKAKSIEILKLTLKIFSVFLHSQSTEI